MKKVFFTMLFAAFSFGLFAQVSQGDVKLIQQYFGTEKVALLKDYMKFTPKQDSAFWGVYDGYEKERQELGKQKFTMIDEYMKNVKDITEAKANEMVDKSLNLALNFKNLQKKYFPKFVKAIGAVKAAQFYQFENYLENVININIQENIPFVGQLEQKHANLQPKK
jgi:hypothetical protein